MESFIRLAAAERRSENRLSACFLCLIAVLPLYVLALVVFFSLLLHFDVVAAQVAIVASVFFGFGLWLHRSPPPPPQTNRTTERVQILSATPGWVAQRTLAWRSQCNFRTEDLKGFLRACSTRIQSPALHCSSQSHSWANAATFISRMSTPTYR
jgi:hypothetical protein